MALSIELDDFMCEKRVTHLEHVRLNVIKAFRKMIKQIYSVPKYFSPKCVGTSSDISVVKTNALGCLSINDFKPKKRRKL